MPKAPAKSAHAGSPKRGAMTTDDHVRFLWVAIQTKEENFTVSEMSNHLPSLSICRGSCLYITLQPNFEALAEQLGINEGAARQRFRRLKLKLEEKDQEKATKQNNQKSEKKSADIEVEKEPNDGDDMESDDHVEQVVLFEG
ncbi:hypothetical protein N7448_009357 [Penicillium atrosanguineum]|uniref:Myb-like DNA-binding domain-containing protein n=1 Tax=Penicillium atrosanguineum TaxID=1132637 RepID=A0A9W9U5R2_9EURO|nr:hypothetical protein N7448_009357 [Penicillium atrosanguineum]KAJ5141890.1 hypothetical protein N7526_002885 [Penicillium atrosanguineum]KAJ5321247.1 hypothetical protein N7476_004249 [Penicillium atrosanguineum]